jgi:hypothetical protein
MNRFSNGTNIPLKWTSTIPSSSVDFLDLTIYIDPNTNRISTRTFQKPMNLHLYIPPHSAHPPGVLKGLIFGSVRRFWMQNTNVSDYRDMIKKFFHQLCQRGHQPDQLKTLFSAAAERIQSTNNSVTTTLKLDKYQRNDIFLHLQYHPQQIPRSVLQSFFKTYCSDELACFQNKDGSATISIDKMTVAYSRPRNIRDIVSRTKLQQPNGFTVQDFLDSCQEPDS